MFVCHAHENIKTPLIFIKAVTVCLYVCACVESESLIYCMQYILTFRGICSVHVYVYVCLGMYVLQLRYLCFLILLVDVYVCVFFFYTVFRIFRSVGDIPIVILSMVGVAAALTACFNMFRTVLQKKKKKIKKIDFYIYRLHFSGKTPSGKYDLPTVLFSDLQTQTVT